MTGLTQAYSSSATYVTEDNELDGEKQCTCKPPMKYDKLVADFKEAEQQKDKA